MSSSNLRRKVISERRKLENRVMRGSKRDFVYNQYGFLLGETLTRDVLAEMLHTLLDLEHKPPTVRSRTGHKIVSTIINVMLRELKAGGKVVLPNMGTLCFRVRRINNTFSKKPNAPKFYLRRELIFRLSGSMEEALQLDTF